MAEVRDPGWYVDPTGRAKWRFWTGAEWSVYSNEAHPPRFRKKRPKRELTKTQERVLLAVVIIAFLLFFFYEVPPGPGEPGSLDRGRLVTRIVSAPNA